MFSRAYLIDAGERALRTIAQTLLATLGAAGTGLIDAPWWAALSAAGMAGVLSLLTSAAGAYAGASGTASLTSAVAPADPSTAGHRYTDDPDDTPP